MCKVMEATRNQITISYGVSRYKEKKRCAKLQYSVPHQPIIYCTPVVIIQYGPHLDIEQRRLVQSSMLCYLLPPRAILWFSSSTLSSDPHTKHPKKYIITITIIIISYTFTTYTPRATQSINKIMDFILLNHHLITLSSL